MEGVQDLESQIFPSGNFYDSPAKFAQGFQTSVTAQQRCRFVPYAFSETKTQLLPTNLNIGCQGLALIQGRIYDLGECNPYLLYMELE